MKTIVLIPVKNEAWIIGNTLQNIAPHVDLVIIADQQSTDTTREICSRFDNVHIIDNHGTTHNNSVRWLLLEEARKYGEHNLIICIDADEVISPKAIEQMRSMVKNKSAEPGDVFSFLWLQLWQDPYHFMKEGPWKDNYKDIAFVDAPGKNEYRKDIVINDHTSRVPDSKIGKRITSSYPLLHFHFLAWKRNQLKQAWYRCTELMHGTRSARRINNTYRITLFDYKVPVYALEPDWYSGIIMPTNIESATNEYYLNEMFGMFKDKSIEFFEGLQIWHIAELKDYFIKHVGREPIPEVFPRWVSQLNEVRHLIRQTCLKALNLMRRKNSSF